MQTEIYLNTGKLRYCCGYSFQILTIPDPEILKPSICITNKLRDYYGVDLMKNIPVYITIFSKQSLSLQRQTFS